MSLFETPTEFRDAVDALLAGTHRQLRVYDHDLSLLEIDHAPRHEALRALCVAGGGRRIELLLADISHVARNHPRLFGGVGKEDTLRGVPPKTQNGPRLLSRGAPHIIGAIKTVLSLDLSPSLRVEPEWGRRLDGARDTALADGARTIINNVG